MLIWVHHPEHFHVAAEAFDEYGEVFAEVYGNYDIGDYEWVARVRTNHPLGELDCPAGNIHEYEFFEFFGEGLSEGDSIIGLEQAKEWIEMQFACRAEGIPWPRRITQEA